MKAEQLWASILQEAIQGRLVPQLESEPEAESEGCYLANPPFSVPKKWKWVQLKSIFAKRPTVTPSVYGDSKVELWSIPAFDAGSPEIVEAKLIGSSKKVIVPGDVLLAKIVPHIKRAWVVSEKNEFIKLASTEWIVFHSERYFSEFLTMALTEPIFHAKLLSTISGMGSLKRANPKKLGEFYIPCPPIQEQIRIMEKLSKLKSIIDNYQFEHLKYTELGKRFPNQLKNSILQEAIQGRLVPQLESEPKVELRNEKESFEIPFEIPSKWQWTTLEQICLQITDGEHKTPKYQNGGVPFLSVKDISSKKLNFSNTKFVSLEDFNVIKKRCHPQKGDILLSKVGSTGIPAIVDTDKEFALFVSVALLKLNKLLVLDKFLWYLLQSPLVQKQAKENTRGIGNKNWVLKAIKATVVPLPPILEQRRIVGQLEKIFSGVNSLSK